MSETTKASEGQRLANEDLYNSLEAFTNRIRDRVLVLFGSGPEKQEAFGLKSVVLRGVISAAVTAQVSLLTDDGRPVHDLPM